MSNIETSTISATTSLELADAVSTTVAQNDVVAVNTAQASICVRNHFEQLAVEREAWENTVYRTSNAQLYVLLQKCYQTYKSMIEDTPEAADSDSERAWVMNGAINHLVCNIQPNLRIDLLAESQAELAKLGA